MRRRLRWSGAALAAALVLGVVSPVGLTPAVADWDPAEPTPLSVPGMPVSLDQAGEVRLWGDNSVGQSTLPAELAGVAVTQVLLVQDGGLALTADGRVVGWGANIDQLHKVPAAVSATKVAQIATGAGSYAAAVTRDGRVLVWGKKRTFSTPLDVPADLSDVKQVAISGLTAAALKNDGSVVTWGSANHGVLDVPDGLTAATITAAYNSFVALTPEGNLVVWGTGAYAAVTELHPDPEPGSVKAFAAQQHASMALLNDNTLVHTEADGGLTPVPEEFQTAEPVLLASGIGESEMAFVDRDRHIHYWNASAQGPGNPDGVPGEIPAELHGQDITQITIGPYYGALGSIPNHIRGGVIVRKLLRADLPRVTGAPAVGSVLTGTPGTFSASPDEVTSQWLVNGAPVAGATGPTLTVTADMVGKSVTYRSTATKGEESASASSAAVVVPAPGPSAACVAAQQAASAATKALTGAKAKLTKATKQLKKAKKSKNTKKVKKAKAQVKKAKKQVKAATAKVQAAGRQVAANC